MFSKYLLIGLMLLQAPAQVQILDQLDLLLKQLRGSFPAPIISVSNADELRLAVTVDKAVIELNKGTYPVNLVLNKSVSISGPATAILTPLNPLEPVITITGNDITVKGLTVLNGATDRDTIVVGSLAATTVAEQPHNIRFTQTVVPAGAGGGHRAFALHGVNITLDQVVVTNYWELHRDSQAVWICNGPGPYTITNSRLEASGENILIGGAQVGIKDMNPSDILIQNNDISKTLSFVALGDVKNLLELKTGIRVRIIGNRFDGNWKDAQAGNAIVFTVRNQGLQCPWCKISDVIFTGNILTNTLDGYGVNILGYDDSLGVDSQQMENVTISHNLFVDSPQGIQVINSVLGNGLVVTNNTFPKISGKFLQFGYSNRPQVLTPLVFNQNVLSAGTYGIMGTGATGPGLASLLANTVLKEWDGNIIESKASIKYPATGTTVIPPGGLLALMDPKTFKLLNGTAGY